MGKGKLRNTDLPGNSMGSHAAYLRQMVRQAETMLDAESVVDLLFEDELIVRSISFRFPQDDRLEYLAVVRVIREGKAMVGFHNAPTLLEAVVGVVNRLKNRSLQFKEDSYAD